MMGVWTGGIEVPGQLFNMMTRGAPLAAGRGGRWGMGVVCTPEWAVFFLVFFLMMLPSELDDKGWVMG